MISQSLLSSRRFPSDTDASSSPPTAASRSWAPRDHAVRERPDAPLLAGLIAALDMVDQGTLILDRDGVILFSNERARQLVGAGRGLFVIDGRLRACAPADARLLASRLACCGEAAPDDVTRHVVKIGEPALLLQITPLRPLADGLGAAENGILVVFNDPAAASLPDDREIRLLFGLTEAETGVAMDILSGDGAKACARRLGTSPETVRTHLRHIYSKTGAKGQAALVRLLLSASRSKPPSPVDAETRISARATPRLRRTFEVV